MHLPRHSHPQRGSLLIVAMILAAVIGISLVSYLQLARTSLTISNRALYNNAAINLAENGLEEAMFAINQTVADNTYAWPSWYNNGTTGTSAAWRKWEDYTFDQNATGKVKVYVYNYKGTQAPKIVARSSISLGGGNSAPIEKWIEVTLKKTSKFSSGLVAKNSIIFNGNNAKVDSWNSDPDNDPITVPKPYPVDPNLTTWWNEAANDNGSVGSISVAVDAVLVKQADIWGFVATGGANPTIGSNGAVLGATSVPDATWASANVDPTRVSTDFSASFDPVTAPAKTYIDLGGQISSNTTLPRPADVAAGLMNADGNYYYAATKVNLTNNYLKASAKVVLKLSETGNWAVDVGGGTGKIEIQTNGSLAIYTEGTIKIAGQGVANGTDANANGELSDAEVKQPINFQIWGTKTSGSQGITIVGNGAFSGVVYAPQGDVTINGNGSVSGSVVANNITLTGNANFHYDESLGNFGGNNPFRVSKWKELTSQDDRRGPAPDYNYGTLLAW